MNRMHKVGAVFYLLWGLLHVVAGATLVGSALTDLDGHLREIGTGAQAAQLPAVGGHPVVSAIVAFHSFNMVWIGLLVALIAVRLNWRNARSGYWLNLALAGFLDLGLLVFLLVPGTMAWSDGWLGPALFAGGALFSTLGRRRRAAAPARPERLQRAGVR
ncbi:MAG: hypothetical protein IT370_30265 [Deltaproteobacteria bacterium]|nr:hypothetical protein [Deltaproteobacteria bacterium]